METDLKLNETFKIIAAVSHNSTLTRCEKLFIAVILPC